MTTPDPTQWYRTPGTARAYPVRYFGINFDIPYTAPWGGREEVPYVAQGFYPPEITEPTLIATLTASGSGFEDTVLDPDVPESMQNSYFLNVPTDLGFVSTFLAARSCAGLYVLRQKEVTDARDETEYPLYRVNMNSYPETSAEDLGFLTFLGAAEDKIAEFDGPLPPDYPSIERNEP